MRYKNRISGNKNIPTGGERLKELFLYAQLRLEIWRMQASGL
jgi:hypothetical protein